MSEQTAARTDVTPQKLQVWENHLYQEFVTRDVEATLATMTEDASINGGGHQ